MTRMDCTEVQDLLPPYVDDELPADERRAVAGHLAACPACAAALADLEALSATVKRAGTHAMPDGFEARLRARVGLATSAERRPGWHWLAGLAASHLAVAAIAAGFAARQVEDWTSRDRALRQVVSAHVRSTLADTPLQVASSDSHTVRPWFVGRLPFAPPVRDLGPEGFPLLGARLDHVLDRTAAALVYGRRKHRINVFVLPLAEAAAAGLALPASAADPPVRFARDGYAVVAWSDTQFAFLAISDLNPAEVERLSQLLRSGGG